MIKIPGAQDIANITAGAMQPMMDRLDRICELLEEQNQLLSQRNAS